MNISLLICFITAPFSFDSQAQGEITEKVAAEKRSFKRTNVLALSSSGGHAKLVLDDLQAWEEFTFGFWINWEHLGYFSCPFLIHTSQDDPAMIGINNSNYRDGFKFYCQSEDRVLIYSEIPQSLTNQGWIHIAVSISASSFKVFFNGNLEQEKSFSQLKGFENGLMNHLLSGSRSPSIYLGKRDHPNNSQFKGEYDDVFIYQRALDQTQIREIMWSSNPKALDWDSSQLFFEDFEGDTHRQQIERLGDEVRIVAADRPQNNQSLDTGNVEIHFKLPEANTGNSEPTWAILYEDGIESTMFTDQEILDDAIFKVAVKKH